MGFWQKVTCYFRGLRIRVEPVIFLTTFCHIAMTIIKPGMTNEKVRRSYPPPDGLNSTKEYYNNLQIIWLQNYDYVNVPVSCLAGIIYGAYGDVKGRKLPLLMAILSVFIENSFHMLMWSTKTDIPFEWSYLAAAICGLLGDYGLIMASANAYLADNFSNKHYYGARMIVLSGTVTAGTFCSSWTTKLIIDKSYKMVAMYMSQVGIVLIFFYALFVLKNPKPAEELKDLKKPDLKLRLQLMYLGVTLWNVFKSAGFSVYDSFKIFFVKRDGPKRHFLWICMLAYFLDEMLFGEQKALIGTYFQLFGWYSNEFARYKGLRPCYQIIGTILGVLVLRKWLKIRDTILIIFSTLSMSVFLAALGFINQYNISYIVFSALVPGGFHGLLNPLTVTFLTCVIETNEVGKILAVCSILSKLAGVAETAILQNIYRATLNWYKGSVWLLMALLAVISAMLYVYVALVARRHKIGPEYYRKKKDNDAEEEEEEQQRRKDDLVNDEQEKMDLEKEEEGESNHGWLITAEDFEEARMEMKV
ncbi:hypothetical protein L596_010406 [Steinernema carpocapsae]|uniref:Major facilitator superfamily (MFS) profile domain-containing protein n=1 Tax=Steinernema carpocapsae TaxID=34508 RepID=A0A4U5PIT1_STECR|nr:hypothetical protein L596_010406 [Steinernema carpocapsae]